MSFFLIQILLSHHLAKDICNSSVFDILPTLSYKTKFIWGFAVMKLSRYKRIYFTEHLVSLLLLNTQTYDKQASFGTLALAQAACSSDPTEQRFSTWGDIALQENLVKSGDLFACLIWHVM